MPCAFDSFASRNSMLEAEERILGLEEGNGNFPNWEARREVKKQYWAECLKLWDTQRGTPTYNGNIRKSQRNIWNWNSWEFPQINGCHQAGGDGLASTGSMHSQGTGIPQREALEQSQRIGDNDTFRRMGWEFHTSMFSEALRSGAL